MGMNLDSLLRIGIDAAAAFAVVNIVNALRQGWLWPRVQRWLEQPEDRQQQKSRIISLAWWVSVAVSGAFALRLGFCEMFMGEWASRVIISWLLAMGQFDVIKLAWPTAFDPDHKSEVTADEGLDP